MAQVTLRFHDALNDFITPVLRGADIVHVFERKTSVKDMIESFHVPHTEVEWMFAQDIAINFDHIVVDQEVIDVYPVASVINFPVSVLLRPVLALPLSFIVDSNLGRLVRYLRLLGFDCLYSNHFDDSEVAEIARDQQRIVLIRDRALLQRKIITYGYYLRSVEPKIQTVEVLKRYGLFSSIKPFVRCTHCNGILREVAKQSIMNRLEPLTRKYFDTFLMCDKCHRIYWEGSHCTRMERLVEAFRAHVSESGK